MSETEAFDHRKAVDYIAVSSSHGTKRRIHKVDGDPDAGDLSNGEPVEPACDTTLIRNDSQFIAKPSNAYPPGYWQLCQNESCFPGQ